MAAAWLRHFKQNRLLQESLCPFTPNVLNQLRQNPGLKPVVESFTLQFAPNNGSIQGGSLCCTGTGERNRRTLAQLRHHAQDQAGGGAGPGSWVDVT